MSAVTIDFPLTENGPNAIFRRCRIVNVKIKRHVRLSCKAVAPFRPFPFFVAPVPMPEPPSKPARYSTGPLLGDRSPFALDIGS